MVRIPITITITCNSQNSAKQIHTPFAKVFHAGTSAITIALIASPPIQVLIPNQPHATSARRTAGTFAPSDAKRRARKYGEGNSVLGAGVRVEQHRHEDQHVSQEHGEDGLLPVHSARDHAARQQVRGNVDAHRDPQRGVVVGAPTAARGGNRREVFVVKGTGADGFGVENAGVDAVLVGMFRGAHRQ